jgi:hypothetical protein
MATVSVWRACVAVVCVAALIGVARGQVGATGESAPASGAALQVAPSFVGHWETTFGAMELRADGDRLEGTYALPSGSTIAGRVEGRRFTFEYDEGEVRGEGWFELAEDGRSFAGEWRPHGAGRWWPWTGTRRDAAPGVVERPGFEGLWRTTFGVMRLSARGGAIEGKYSFGGGSQIAGAVSGGRFTFEYREATARGEGWFELAADGRSFAGQWRQEGTETWREWGGTRVEPRAGVVWLVVFEAHWEEALSEPEYAFGDMLQSYFTMAQSRHVQTRHRFFHDATDLRRLCGELWQFAEPVVLVLSTHGVEQGIGVNGEVIGGTELGESLRGADAVEVVHLSGCSMIRGPMASEIRRASGRPDLPVSGYSTDVAWDASAIADFVYLSLILNHRLPADRAVQEAHLAAPFTGHARLPGCTFEPLGLMLGGMAEETPGAGEAGGEGD